MTEAALQAQVRRMARAAGFLDYHTHDSRRSTPGFPDLVLVHLSTGRVIFAELKMAKGRVTPEQRRWLAALSKTCEAVVWRPGDLFDGSIAAALTAQGDPR